MAHAADIDFMNMVGGRTVTDNKANEFGGTQPSIADKILDAQEKALLYKATQQAFGFPVGGEEGGVKKTTDDAPTIVSSAFQQMGNMVKETNENVARKEQQLSEARKEVNQAQAHTYEVQLEMMKEMLKGLQVSQEDLKNANSPERALAIVNTWRQALTELMPKATAESHAAVAAGPSDEVTLTIEKMRMDHELAMKKLDYEIEHGRQEWQLQLQQFQEDTNHRWREYQDGLKMRTDAYQSFTDIAAALAAGVDKEAGFGSDEEGGNISATVSAFKCQSCGQQVNVPPGAEKVKCDCGTEYDVNWS